MLNNFKVVSADRDEVMKGFVVLHVFTKETIMGMVRAGLKNANLEPTAERLLRGAAVATNELALLSVNTLKAFQLKELEDFRICGDRTGVLVLVGEHTLGEFTVADASDLFIEGLEQTAKQAKDELRKDIEAKKG